MRLVNRLSVTELPAWPTSDSAGRTFCLDGDSGGCKSPPHRKREALAFGLHNMADIATIDDSMAAVGGLRAIALHNATVRFRVSLNAIAVVHGTAAALQAEKDHPPGLKIAHPGRYAVSVEICFGLGLHHRSTGMLKPTCCRPYDPDTHLPTTTSPTPRSSTN